MLPTLKPQFSLGRQRLEQSPMLRKRIVYSLVAFLTVLSLWLSQAQVSHSQGPNVRDRIRDRNQTTEEAQPSRLSTEQEMRVGQKMNQDLLRSGEFKLYQNPDIQNYVVGIGERLLPYSDRADELTYTFQVIQDNQINAFATMGGYVYITTGLMEFADNEAQLASVVGHEIGHIDGKHLLEQIREDGRLDDGEMLLSRCSGRHPTTIMMSGLPWFGDHLRVPGSRSPSTGRFYGHISPALSSSNSFPGGRDPAAPAG